MCQSVVLVSRYPFPSLFYRLLSKVEEALLCETASGAGVLNCCAIFDLTITDDLYNALAVGFQQLEGWSIPVANNANYLPSFGDV